MGDVDSAEVEVWALSGRSVHRLLGDRVAVGKTVEDGIILAGDPMVSRLHALLERFGTAWSVRDLGSSNGTFVNGERLWSSQQLRHGDEIRVGRTRLLFRDSASASVTETAVEEGPPSLTARERDVLTVLCGPLLDRDLFTDPASVREIAEQLVISEAAVKQHLTNLYAKFGVEEMSQHRRSRLANEALRRAAVTLNSLRRGDGG